LRRKAERICEARHALRATEDALRNRSQGLANRVWEDRGSGRERTPR
jgi:hypothetical protein